MKYFSLVDLGYNIYVIISGCSQSISDQLHSLMCMAFINYAEFSYPGISKVTSVHSTAIENVDFDGTFF